MSVDRHHPQYRKIITSRRWRSLRKKKLEDAHYLCEMCRDDGIVRPATSVHHIRKVMDAPELAFEEKNLLALCDCCHSEMERFASR